MIKLLTLTRREKQAAKTFLLVDSPAGLLMASFVFKLEDRNCLSDTVFLSLLLLQGSSSTKPREQQRTVLKSFVSQITGHFFDAGGTTLPWVP